MNDLEPSSDRLTPEYRAPDDDLSSPLDYSFHDLLPYDSFDDDSFVADSPTAMSEITLGSSVSDRSDPLYFDLEAMDHPDADEDELRDLMLREEVLAPLRADPYPNHGAPDMQALAAHQRALQLERQLLEQNPLIGAPHYGLGRNSDSPSDFDIESFLAQSREASSTRRSARNLQNSLLNLGSHAWQLHRGSNNDNPGPQAATNPTPSQPNTPGSNATSGVDQLLDGIDLERLFTLATEMSFPANQTPNSLPVNTRRATDGTAASGSSSTTGRDQPHSGPGAMDTYAVFQELMMKRLERRGIAPEMRRATVDEGLVRLRRWQRTQAGTTHAGPSLRPRREGNISQRDVNNGPQASTTARATPRPGHNFPRSRDELVDFEVFRHHGIVLPQAPGQVIDLTEEPDSPEQQRETRPPRASTRNLRRHASQVRANPPPLARSDSSILGGGDRAHVVIDLTDDDPEPNAGAVPGAPGRSRERPPLPGSPELLILHSRPTRPMAANPAGPRPHPLHPQLRGFDSRFESRFESLRRTLANGANIIGLLNPVFPERPFDGAFDPLGRVNLQYEFHAFNRRPPSPKPTPEAPQPAREGFTRDTDPETAFVCPGCNEELSYDPDEVPTESGPPRSSKSKRPRSEHHFWAIKSCGHVYCSDCFENRKPNGKRAKIFPNDPSASTGSNAVCAVDGCYSPIGNKSLWVGIFM